MAIISSSIIHLFHIAHCCTLFTTTPTPKQNKAKNEEKKNNE